MLARYWLATGFLTISLVLGIAFIRPLESIQQVSTSDLSSMKPVHLSKRLFLPAKCSVQLYGWINESPAFGAADEYIEISKIDALLDSQPLSVAPGPNGIVSEHIWEFKTASSGVLSIVVHDYRKPARNLKYADIFLSCSNSTFSRVVVGMFFVACLFGLIGIFLLLRSRFLE